MANKQRAHCYSGGVERRARRRRGGQVGAELAGMRYTNVE
jgi:hypothetical protein